MRLLVTIICVFIVGFASGQKLSDTKPVLAYGVNLNMGNASIKTWLGRL
jgi:hypothetical protein